MTDIPQIDLAWEAVSALRIWSTEEGFANAVGKALTLIEQLGGKQKRTQNCSSSCQRGMPRPRA